MSNLNPQRYKLNPDFIALKAKETKFKGILMQNPENKHFILRLKQVKELLKITPIKGEIILEEEEKPKPKPVLNMKLKSFQERAINNIIEKIDENKLKGLINPINGKIIKNTIKNRNSVNKQIEKHNVIIFENLNKYIEENHSRGAVGKYFKTYKIENVT